MLRRLSTFMPGTLRGRLIISVALVHSVLMTLFITDLTTRQRTMLLERQIEEATALSRSLATSSALWIAAHDVSGLQELVETQSRYPEILFAIVADEDGRVLAATDKSRLGLYLLNLPAKVSLTVISGTSSLVDVMSPALVGNRHVGWARIGIGQKKSNAKLIDITQSGIIYAIIATIIGSAIAWVMGLKITRRLYSVQKTIDTIRSGDRLARSTITGTDEAAMLAREFNSMLDALSERDKEVEASGLRYQSLIENVQTGIVVHNGQGEIIIGNPMAMEILGLSHDQMLGKDHIDPYWSFLKENGSVMPVAEYPVSLVLNQKQPLKDYTTGIRRSDRDYTTWTLVNAKPEFNDEGEITQVIVSFIDITERNKQVQELQRWKDIFEHAEWGIVMSNPDGNTLGLMNPAFARMHGFSIEELTGQPIISIFTPEQRKSLPEQITLAHQKGHHSFESTHLRKDGSTFPAFIDITAVRGSDGKVSHRIVNIQDTTERMVIENELLKQEKYSQSLLRLSRKLEQSQSHSEALNAAQNEVRHILGYQNLWAYLFTKDKKYAHALVAGGSKSDYVMSEEGTATLTITGDKMLEEIVSAKEIVIVADAQTDERVNKEIVTAMGNRTLINVPIILSDKHLGCIGTGTFGDEGVRVPSSSEQSFLMGMASHLAVTFDRINLLAERNKAEAEIRKLNQELEQRVTDRTALLEAANKELEAFSYSVSHDLRTPLRAIDGFSGILLEDYALKLDDEGKRLLNVIRSNTIRMGQLIDDILRFSRAGRTELNSSKIDMERLAKDVSTELQSSVENKNLQVTIEPIPPSTGDSSMMRQVFVNLLSNSIKFSRGMKKPMIKIGGSVIGSEAVYFVQDNGTGFDMTYVGKLFGVFQRLHSVTDFEGTGIGLAIVKRIINRHGGRVWAESKIDEGTTIFFSLPEKENKNAQE